MSASMYVVPTTYKLVESRAKNKNSWTTGRLRNAYTLENYI